MNTEYPLLMFPKPVRPIERSKLGGGGGKFHVPSVEENLKRMAPKLKHLVEALDNRKMNLQQDAEGVNPEDVLVLETVGRIDDFYKAIQKIEGFEWLLEEDIDRDADEYFFEIDDKGIRKEKSIVASRLYLISTNTAALKNLVTLYHRYTENSKIKFDEGYSKFKEVFAQLRDVRFWDYRDRLDGSNFLEEWLRNNETFPDNAIKFQIELWFRDSENRRKEAEQKVTDLLNKYGGKILSRCVIPEIRYHAMMVQVPALALRKIVSDVEDGSLIKSRDIMYFKALPQAVSNPAAVEDLIPIAPEVESLPNGEPVVALLDGYPLAHHRLLDGRLRIDDPDGFEDGYMVEHRKHGTEMASLIIHGDLSRGESAIDTPLYVRPVMRPDIRGTEQMPEDVLAVDLVHRAVKRMFEGEGNDAPTAPHVKIINFSIGDPLRIFHHAMSPMARLLDWLSYKYEVLFVISAGNTGRFFETDCTLAELKAKGQTAISTYVTQTLLGQQAENRLLSPAESINNLTVGATHSDGSGILDGEPRINPYDGLHPAIYSPFGGGMKRSVKPDLLYDGGRQMLEESRYSAGKLCQSTYKRMPGIQVAYPDSNLDKKLFDRGTSFSAALISRYAYQCYKTACELLDSYGMSYTHIHLLVKAMAVHGCSWDIIGDNIEKYLPPIDDKKELNALKRRWLGYGYPNLEKSLMCNPHRVTVLGYAELESGKAHEYKLPLPQSIQGEKVKRRLTVTLSWMSPISPQNQKYRQARMWFETTEHSDIASIRKDIKEYQAVRRGTLQHEVFEDEKRYPFDENASLCIKVNCAEDAGELSEPIKYALAVTLELGVGEQLLLFTEHIYEEIRNRLRMPLVVRIQ